MVYLALYKGESKSWRKRLVDKVIRFTTSGKYSHCEIAIEKRIFRTGERYPETVFDCYSASLRDGGVRHKRIDVRNDKWDLIPLSWVKAEQIEHYFEQTKGAKYDLGGALSVVLPFHNSKGKYFCSEWCANAIFSVRNWTVSPTELAKLVREKGELNDTNH